MHRFDHGKSQSRVCCAGLVLAVWAALASHASADPIEIVSTPVALAVSQPDARRVGQLIYRGGVALASSDRRFGGLSGMLVSPDGKRFLAISDRGYWVEAELTYADGELAGVANGLLRNILDANGKEISGDYRDAEGLARLHGVEDTVLVSFERQQRVYRYEVGTAKPTAIHERAFDNIAAASFNAGIEGLVYLPNGSLLAITEATRNAAGDVVGWLRTAQGDRPVTLHLPKHWGLTDLAVLPGGDVLTLERWFRPIYDLRIRLRRIPASAIIGSAPLDGPVVAEFGRGHSMDNMEGLDTRRLDDGRVMIYMISDDNFSPLQRTLLYMFEFAPDSPAR